MHAPRVSVALALLLAGAAAQALPDFRGTLVAAQQVVAACAARQAACGTQRVPPDVLPSVADPGSTPALRLDWLRSALVQASKAPPDQRATSMQQAAARLQHELAQLNAPVPVDAHARLLTDHILAERQFRNADRQPSWWQLMQARFWRWVSLGLASTAEAAEHRPWLGTLVEWTSLLLALSGVLAYVLRLARRDRLRLELPWRPEAGAPAVETVDWSAAAGRAAAAGAWREAVHALYWSAITRLAETGRWRATPVRTPREYLRLLTADSPEQLPLARLTTLLEQAWYAGRPVSRADYDHAGEQARLLGVPAVESGA